jgi:hypothetical protein
MKLICFWMIGWREWGEVIDIPGIIHKLFLGNVI